MYHQAGCAVDSPINICIYTSYFQTVKDIFSLSASLKLIKVLTVMNPLLKLQRLCVPK